MNITEYEQIGWGEGGAQKFLGPRGVKYLNTGLAIGICTARLDTEMYAFA